MKKLKESLIFKFIIHASLFFLGIFIIFSCYHMVKFLNTYSYNLNIFSYPQKRNFSYTDTMSFEKRFSKYAERIAAYIQLKEKGYKTEGNSTINNPLINGDSYNDSEQTHTNQEQLDFEFYNKKLNTNNTNFIFYVLNQNTGDEYYSPYFEKKEDGTKGSIADTRKNITSFIENIDNRDSYFILNTKQSRYATNKDKWGYMTPQNISWISDCIKGLYSISTPKEDATVTQEKVLDDEATHTLTEHYGIPYEILELINEESISPDILNTYIKIYFPGYPYQHYDKEHFDTYIREHFPNQYISKDGSINIDSEKSYEEDTPNDYIIYASVIDSFPNTDDDFYSEYEQYLNLYGNYVNISHYFIPSIILFLLLLTAAVLSAGYSKDKNNIKLMFLDRIYTELTILFLIGLLYVYFIANYNILTNIKFSEIYITNKFPYPLNKIALTRYMLAISLYSLLYPMIITLFLSIVRKIKSKTIIKNTLIYTTFNLLKKIFLYSKTSFKISFMVIGFFMINVSISIFVYYGNGGLVFYILCMLIVYIVTGYFLIKYFSQLKLIIDETKQISEGDLLHKIPTENYFSSLNDLGNSINNIGDGLSNAVDEKLKSERLKTELITNVSHDIKTPLTSIINYVDLLKKENLENTTVKNYLEVLEAKSWRLKTLIEDLVEASKASSGSMQLHLERINIVELVRQSAGEFEDRFKDKELELVLTIEKEPIYILADGRSTFRIVENVFSNVTKYSLSGTRVYVNIYCSDNNVTICVKNISSNKLNINSDELMERFVRGDLARNTEGSGLGLSIARSLASLQKGDFDIELDGDLFKAIISFSTFDEENVL